MSGDRVRRAAVLAVGSELLGTDRLDTNSLRLAAALERCGVELTGKAVVGDDRGRIASELRRLAADNDLVLVTGGLGPTADDLTREGLADAFGLELVSDASVIEDIETKFRSFGRRMPEVNRRQAMVPAGAEVLANDRGTAPGLRLDAGGASFFLFPGVPGELDGLVERSLEPWLAERTAGERVETGVLKVACLPESEVEERIEPAYRELGREAISVLAHPGEIELRFRAGGPAEERRSRLAAMAARLRELVGPAVFTDDAERSLAAAVGELLDERGLTVATAESCTGGMVAEAITRVAGSSRWFVGGAVVYSNRLKTELVGVPAELIERHGAVSSPVVRALAAGARDRLGADFGIGITGIAGPGGGSEEKPVGTVYLAVVGAAADPSDDAVEERRVQLPGDRQRVRRLSMQLALEMLRRRLLATAPGAAAGAAAAGEEG